MKEDILINMKSIDKNIQKFEAIGGKNLFVLLNTQQDEGLKVRGFAR